MSEVHWQTYRLCLYVFMVLLCSYTEVVRGVKTGTLDAQGEGISDDQRQEFVITINAMRSSVGASNMRKMQWSDMLKTAAARIANACPSKVSIDLTPCPHVYGNVYVTDDVTIRLLDVIDRWEEQGVLYDYTDNTCIKEGQCKEYRNLMWYSADRVGCAVSSCQTPGGTTVTPTWIFLCFFSPGSPTLERPYLQGPPGSDCPTHLTIDKDGLCTGGPHIACPPEAAPFTMSNTDGAVGLGVITVDNAQVADKSLLKALNYMATQDSGLSFGGGNNVAMRGMAPLAAPLTGGTQDTDVASSNMVIPEWAAWFIVLTVATVLLMVLAVLLIEYKKRTVLFSKNLYPQYEKPRKYRRRLHHQYNKNRHRPHRHHRKRRANRILPSLERQRDLHLHRPVRAFNNNYFRSHSRAPPTGILQHYTGACSYLYEENMSSRPQRAQARNRRGSQRGLLNSPTGSPELGQRPRSGGRRFPSTLTSVGLWPPTGIPITNIENAPRGDADYGNQGASDNRGNGQNRNNGHHGQYENHWGEHDSYQNMGGPPPYSPRPPWQNRYESSHTINDFLTRDPSDLLS